MVRWALLGLEGFRLIAGRTYCFYAWCLLVPLSALAGVYAGGGLLGALRIELTPAAPLQQPAAALVIVAPGLCLASLAVAAVYRSVLEPDSPKWAYLRLGLAEARTLLFTVVAGSAWAGLNLALLTTGRWALLAELAAFALWSPFVLTGPAVFRSGRGLRTGWRLGAAHWRGLLVMNLVTFALCAAGLMAVQFLWRAWATEVTKGASLAFEPSNYAARLAPGFIPAAMAYTAIFVIAVAPAAAAYRKLTAPDDQADRAEAA